MLHLRWPNDTETWLLSSIRFPLSVFITPVLHIHSSITQGWTMAPLDTAVPHSHILNQWQLCLVGLVIGLQVRSSRNRYYITDEEKQFSSPKRPDHLRGPPCFPSNGQGSGVILTILYHLLRRQRMFVTILLLPHTPSGRAREQRYISLAAERANVKLHSQPIYPPA